LEGRAEVIESYQQTINERFALLKDIHMNRPSGAKEPYDSLEKVTGKELVSSVSRFHNYIIFSDTGCQRVLKHNFDTKITSTINSSNCKVPGVAIWSVCNLDLQCRVSINLGAFN